MITRPSMLRPLPAISHVRALDLAGDGKIEVVGSDMRQGFVAAGRAGDPAGRLRILGQAVNPSNFQIGDLDGDRRPDLFVADLGSFQPEDHTVAPSSGSAARRPATRRSGSKGGRASRMWNRPTSTETASRISWWRPLAGARSGTSRCSRTGRPTTPSLVRDHVIDPRPGGIHAIPVDMNGDGKLDIVALFSQQFEQVVVYTNTGNFTFTPTPIYTAPHPNWGSTGIQVVDLDGDGDLDVLMTHGDTFDDQI